MDSESHQVYSPIPNSNQKSKPSWTASVRRYSQSLAVIVEQRKLAGLVEKVEGLRKRQKERKRELENLFQSLMQQAFRRELVG